MQIFLALAAALALAGCHRQKPPPSIDGLSAALERSAEKALAAPSLADEQIVLDARPGQRDARVAEVQRACAAAGATALTSTNAAGQVSMLAAIPEVNVDAFKAALQHQPATMQTQHATSTRLIEVVIENAASPSPAP
jgi:hypothetical protein